MTQRLRQAQEDVAIMRRQKEIQTKSAAPQVSAAPPPMEPMPVSAAPPLPKSIPRDGPQNERITWILTNWDHAHGPVMAVAPKLFAHCDTDHDGKLQWNQGEIRMFVHELFKHYDVHLPQWQDRVWYELYRQCDRDQDYALEMREICGFAKHCFELASHAYGALPDSEEAAHHHQPLGHGYQEAEVAGTIQSVLASALNPLTGGVLHNVTIDIFQQLDRNRDGRIEWNNGEVKGFVSALFNRYAVPMPQWADQVWYDMYHMCDIERRHSINIDEAMMFARTCFEAALNSLMANTPRGATPR